MKGSSLRMDPRADAGAYRLVDLVRRAGRENRETKARCLLIEGRVGIRRVDARGVLADVRAAIASLRRVIYDAHSELWSCPCPARTRCSHVAAIQLVVIVTAPEPDRAERR